MRYLLLLLLLPSLAMATVRSDAARHAFVRVRACPATHAHRLPCPGYIIDHIVPLDCGGLDEPSNMQWQTTRASRAKDRWERNGASCRHPTKAAP